MSQTDVRQGHRSVLERSVDQSAAVFQSLVGYPSALLVTGLVTVLYLAVYLVALGHLNPGSGAIGLTVVADPFARSLQRVSMLTFEPVALLELGVASLQVAPANVALGVILGVLAGLNAALGWLAWRRPACRVDSGAGALAGVPALLSGAACCGPTLLFVLGVQVTSAALAAVVWLVPLSIILLLASLVFAASRLPT